MMARGPFPIVTAVLTNGVHRQLAAYARSQGQQVEECAGDLIQAALRARNAPPGKTEAPTPAPRSIATQPVGTGILDNLKAAEAARAAEEGYAHLLDPSEYRVRHRSAVSADMLGAIAKPVPKPKRRT
jgi:hypothetical protein